MHTVIFISLITHYIRYLCSAATSSRLDPLFTPLLLIFKENSWFEIKIISNSLMPLLFQFSSIVYKPVSPACMRTDSLLSPSSSVFHLAQTADADQSSVSLCWVTWPRSLLGEVINNPFLLLSLLLYTSGSQDLPVKAKYTDRHEEEFGFQDHWRSKWITTGPYFTADWLNWLCRIVQ